ncbi:MAG: hypothetical protein PHI40_03825, partial [Caldisericia bacterium]|nr:hypothetical protein [Caldisericia bacterium]
MRKLMSYVIVLALLLTTLAVPHSVPTTVEAATGNRPATFIANRFVKIGFDRDGLPLYPARMFPWQQNENIPVWGRDDYPMPNAFQARGDHSINVPAVIDETDVVPVAWTDVYLTVVPDGGDSQEYDHWYVVLDSAGQLWFDPDGRFHDCRYNAYTDPASAYYIPGSCRTKSHALHGDRLYMVDPMSDNNTQGPYIINPNHRLYNPNVALTFQAKGTRYGTRKWQIGWSDMVDYPPMRNIY